MFNNPKTIEISDIEEVVSLEVTQEPGKPVEGEEGEVQDVSLLHAVFRLKSGRPYDERPNQFHVYSPMPLPFNVPVEETEAKAEPELPLPIAPPTAPYWPVGEPPAGTGGVVTSRSGEEEDAGNSANA